MTVTPRLLGQLDWRKRLVAGDAGEAFATATEHRKHGNRIERWWLWASSALRDYLAWSGAQPVCEVERRREVAGKVSTEVADAITSLVQATQPRELLAIWQRHRAMENRLHDVRDVTFGEDPSCVHSGAAPPVLAELRNITFALLQRAGHTTIAASLRAVACQLRATLALLEIRTP